MLKLSLRSGVFHTGKNSKSKGVNNNYNYEEVSKGYNHNFVNDNYNCKG